MRYTWANCYGLKNKTQCRVALLFQNNANVQSQSQWAQSWVKKKKKEKRIHASQISIRVSITHRQSHVYREYGCDGSSTWPGYCPVAAEECCEGSTVCERQRERKETASDSEAGPVCNSAKLTGGDILQTWSPIPESWFTKKLCYYCNKKEEEKNAKSESCLYSESETNAFLYVRTGSSALLILFFFSNQNVSHTVPITS